MGHQAVDSLTNLFTKATHDLAVVQHRLEREFQQTYPDNDLIDKAQRTLVGNRKMIHKMQASAQISLKDDSDDTAYANFNQIIDEWAAQVQSRVGGEKDVSNSEDINKLLFSAII
ncbi:hypothetical protein SAY87_025076 [Trapa incisa]|uniref:Protein FAM33A n=1 Tax=Trapa incisa TaxID=236973 RepID=A0AAN7JGF4_9MYRT|nr:hypothetical protein SAY87_025076 [Trapa incisa]